MMKKIQIHLVFSIVFAGLVGLSPVAANAGNVAWNVSVGGGYAGGYGYGGGWRPAAYGPGWGRGYGYGYGGGWRGQWAGAGYYGYPPAVYYAPPVVAYVSPPQPMVLAAQPQPAVWYYCEASAKYFPYVQECPTGWQTQAATPPTSGVAPVRPQY
jgi:hypothetical protein